MTSPNLLMHSNQPLLPLKSNTQVLPFDNPAASRVFLDQNLPICYNMDIQSKKELVMKSIRELKAKQAALLERYHAEHRALEEQITAIRAKRGYELKQYNDQPWFEQGRDQEPGPR